MKDDLISRQDAIDALRMDISIIPFAKAREYVREAIETIYNRIEELPRVQPKTHEERTETHACDCISRQAAIDTVVFECGEWTGLAKEISKQLRQLPPAQPEPQWIPVERELPEEQGYYITSNEYGGVIEDFYCDDYFWIADRNGYKVIAWMPKPEPYKERRTDE